ncbi:MAG: Na+/H+ antiporter NhaC, partial [Treponema sp.]|nr:Na+/H+ antiporter NhaC [Treponema sp.]
ETGVGLVDDLLTKGGLEGMMYSVALVILAMIFGGIMERTGQLEVVVAKAVGGLKSATALVSATMLTSLASNIAIPDQYISLVVPGRMFSAEYKRRGLHPKMCANALASAGTVTSPLVPWSTCAITMATFLGVATIEYLPFALFNILGPIVVVAMTGMGLLTVERSQDPASILDEEAE